MAKNPLEVPAPENIESSKLEWGPELGSMSRIHAQEIIKESNKNLKKGEKLWRLPTKDELVAEFQKTGSTPSGFQGKYYWSGTTHSDDRIFAYIVSMDDGSVDNNYENENYLVRLVR